MTTHKKWRGEVEAAALREGAVAVEFEVTRGRHQFAHITFPGKLVGKITISLSPSDGNAIMAVRTNIRHLKRRLTGEGKDP